jgi:hypothetical protein
MPGSCMLHCLLLDPSMQGCIHEVMLTQKRQHGCNLECTVPHTHQDPSKPDRCKSWVKNSAMAEILPHPQFKFVKPLQASCYRRFLFSQYKEWQNFCRGRILTLWFPVHGACQPAAWPRSCTEHPHCGPSQCLQQTVPIAAVAQGRHAHLWWPAPGSLDATTLSTRTIAHCAPWGFLLQLLTGKGTCMLLGT